MSDRDTPLTTLRRINAPNDPKVREVRLVRHSSGRMAEVCRLTNGVLTLRPVPVENLDRVMVMMDHAEARVRSNKRTG
jgi:hypothetical protein